MLCSGHYNILANHFSRFVFYDSYNICGGWYYEKINKFNKKRVYVVLFLMFSMYLLIYIPIISYGINNIIGNLDYISFLDIILSIIQGIISLCNYLKIRFDKFI